MIIIRRKNFSMDINTTGELRFNGIPWKGRPLRFKLNEKGKKQQESLGIVEDSDSSVNEDNE